MGRLRPAMKYFGQFQKNLGENRGYVGILVQTVTGMISLLLIVLAFILPFLSVLDAKKFEGPLTEQMVYSALKDVSVEPFTYSLVFAVIVLLFTFFICVGTQHAMVLSAKGELKGQSFVKVVMEGGKRYSLRFVGFALAYIFAAMIVSVAFGMLTMVASTDFEGISEWLLTLVLSYVFLLPMPFIYALTFEEGPIVVMKSFMREHPVMFWGLPLLFGGVALIPLVSLVLNVMGVFLPLYYMTVFVEDMKESKASTHELKTED